MEAIAISSTPREGRGKGAARKLRAVGQIPAIAYGHGIEASIPLTLDPKALEKALDNPYGANALFDLAIEGGAHHRVLVRDLQRHPVSREVLHVDLVAPDLDEPVVSPVPVKIIGKSIGVTTGGRLRTPYREVRLKAKPADFPADVTIDITNLDHNDGVMASEMPLPEGVEPVYDRDYVVVKVVAPRGRKATEEEAEKGKKKKK